MTPLYQNSRVKVLRTLQVVLWSGALGLVGWLCAAMQAGSPDAGLALALLAPVFSLFIFGYEYYLTSYVVSLADTPAGLRIETLSSLTSRTRTVDWRDVTLGQERHDWFLALDAPSVDNRYMLLRLPGRTLPLIVDTTKERPDMKRLNNRLASGKADRWPSSGGAHP